MRSRRNLACALLAAAPLANAADEVGKVYLVPQGGYVRTDKDRQVDDDLYYAVGIGIHVNRRWSFELNGTGGRHDELDGSGRLKLASISVDALRVFNREGAISPFLSAGVGYIEDNPEPGASRAGPLGEVGLGLMLDIAESSKHSFVLQLRPEVKARWDSNRSGAESSSIDYMVGLGVKLAFGSPPALRAASNGSAVQPIARLVAHDDPETQIPALPPEVIVLEGVRFHVGSDTLTPMSLGVLDELAAQLGRHPKVKIEVEGHTDDRGDDAFNMQLSQRRADAVRDHLIVRGVPASQVSSKGHGENRPVAENATPTGRAINRRVTIAIISNPDRVKIETAAR